MHVSVHSFKPATTKQLSMHTHTPFGSTAKCRRILVLLYIVIILVFLFIYLQCLFYKPFSAMMC